MVTHSETSSDVAPALTAAGGLAERAKLTGRPVLVPSGSSVCGSGRVGVSATRIHVYKKYNTVASEHLAGLNAR